MSSGEEIPLCTSCGHHHEQGVKCTICGHVGKSQIYMKMRLRSNEKRQFRLDHFGSFGSNIDDFVIDLIVSIRNPSNQAAKVGTFEGLWDSVDSSSGHTVAYVGDCPVGCIRYRIVSLNEVNTSFAVILDKLHIYQSFLQRKFTWKILFQWLNQVSQYIPQIQQIVLLAPVNSWIEGRSIQLGFQRIASSPLCSFDSSIESFLSLVVENSQALYNIVAYLKTRAEV
mmetsp:Transcript_31410/g.34295  ORF Transcript_31410/g.34295 Transcript_31410/m.34295 type:complete len:226 (+) Transcript_31410:125-802(+)